MANRFDPVAEGIEQERAVVMRMVLLTDARRAIVFPAVSQSASVELAHLSPVARLETPVTRRVEIRLRRLVDGKAGMKILVGIAPHAITERIGPVIDFGDPEGVHDRIIERSGDCDIRDRDGDVIEYVHGLV